MTSAAVYRIGELQPVKAPVATSRPTHPRVTPRRSVIHERDTGRVSGGPIHTPLDVHVWPSGVLSLGAVDFATRQPIFLRQPKQKRKSSFAFDPSHPSTPLDRTGRHVALNTPRERYSLFGTASGPGEGASAVRYCFHGSSQTFKAWA
jgi:hypothetical protein